MSVYQQIMAALSSGGSIAAFTMPAGASEVSPAAISADGSSIMGMRIDSGVTRAWRWNNGTHSTTGASFEITSQSVFASGGAMMLGVSGTTLNLFDGTTTRALPALPANDTVHLLAMSADGDKFVLAYAVSGVFTTRLYAGAQTYLPAGTGLTYRTIAPLPGYSTYMGMRVLNSGIFYARCSHTVSGASHIGRGTSTDTTPTIVLSSITAGDNTQPGFVTQKDDADTVAMPAITGAGGWVVYAYAPGDGAARVDSPSGSFSVFGYDGTTRTLFGAQENATYIGTPAKYVFGSGWTTYAQPASGASPSARIVAPPNGANLLVMGNPDGTAGLYDTLLYTYNGSSYTALPRHADTVEGICPVGDVKAASTDFSTIAFSGSEASETEYKNLLRNGVLTDLN